MNTIRYSSDPAPSDGTGIARRTSLVAMRAAAMGIVSTDRVPTATAETLGELLRAIQDAGIGRGLVREVPPSYGTDEVASLLDDLESALEASPVPEKEWPALLAVFDASQLGELLGISASSLKRYASGARGTPDDVAARLHLLALVVGDLAGSYNEIGVRRWFDRTRSQLDGKAPAAMLRGPWDPDDSGPSRVRALAAALHASPAT